MKKLFILLLISSLASCITQKEYTIDNHKGKLLLFGSAGGFANTTEEFRIYENGQFEKYTSDTESITALERLDRKTCKQLFKNFYELGFDEMQLNAPGNLNYYINMLEGTTETKLLWGSFDTPPPSSVTQFYKVLAQLAKKQKTNNK